LNAFLLPRGAPDPGAPPCIRQRFFPLTSASILKDGRAVFNIAGNKYRIVVWINYPYRVVYVRFIGSHRQYDRIDAQTV
jgi:mRNA interferase HigB